LTDILIGAADLLSMDQIRPWVKSARASGFEGDIYLICYRIGDDIRLEAPKYGVELYEVEHTPYGTPIQHSAPGTPTQAHNMRFYHAWELLTRLGAENYDFVIMTDARDVYFKRNPSAYLRYQLASSEYDFIAPYESIQFAQEEWNANNIIQGFGQVHWEVAAKNWGVYNVGTIAGRAQAMRDLFQTIFAMTEGRYYPSDQSSWNVLVHGLLADRMFIARERDAWAAQCGTTLDPTKAYLWERLTEARPRIVGPERVVVNSLHQDFVMVHQWDRCPELKDFINERYK
jgi:hypothetical protein